MGPTKIRAFDVIHVEVMKFDDTLSKISKIKKLNPNFVISTGRNEPERRLTGAELRAKRHPRSEIYGDCIQE